MLFSAILSQSKRSRETRGRGEASSLQEKFRSFASIGGACRTFSSCKVKRGQEDFESSKNSNTGTRAANEAVAGRGGAGGVGQGGGGGGGECQSAER